MFGLHITGFVLLQHDNCYYSERGLPWATRYKLTVVTCVHMTAYELLMLVRIGAGRV